jgi:hypothetical protein
MSENTDEYVCANVNTGITFIMNARPCHFLVVNGKKVVICSSFGSPLENRCLMDPKSHRLEAF